MKETIKKKFKPRIKARIRKNKQISVNEKILNNNYNFIYQS